MRNALVLLLGVVWVDGLCDNYFTELLVMSCSDDLVELFGKSGMVIISWWIRRF